MTRKEYQKKYVRQHYLKYRDLYLKRSKERRLRLSATGEWQDYQKKYGKKNKMRIKERMRIYWKNLPKWKKLYQYMKARCERPNYSGVSVKITADEFKSIWDEYKGDILRCPCVHRIEDGNYSKGNIRVMEFKEHAKLHRRKKED